MAQYRTDGIILKRISFGEADRILTIFTQKHGKITALAKGVRRMESRKGGTVELLNWVTLFLAEGRTMDIVTEAQAKETFTALKENLVRAGYAYHMLELLDRLLPERDPHPDIFALTTTVLTLLSRTPRQLIIRTFEVRLLCALGFWSLSQVETREGRVRDILTVLEKGTWDEVLNTHIDERLALALDRVLQSYIEHVLEGSLKSRKFLHRIKRPTFM